MSAAAQVEKKNGHIIVAAECWDGIPSNSDYEKILTSVGNVNELMDYIRSKESSLKDTWQIYFQARIQMNACYENWRGMTPDSQTAVFTFEIIMYLYLWSNFQYSLNRFKQ